jgi:hypothetical protein
MNGRRIDDNEMIAAYRQMRKNPSLKQRALRAVIESLPKPLKRWLLELLIKRYHAIALRQGFTQADWEASAEFVMRMREQEQRQ